MNKWTLVALLFVTFLLSACSQNEEDLQNYSGVIGEGKAVGYEYSVIKEENRFIWEIGYKGDMSIIREDVNNENYLERFRLSVNESQMALAKLMISVSYLLFVLIAAFIFYKKYRRMLHGIGLVILVFAGIAVYHVFVSSVDLSSSLHDAKFYYLLLTN